MSENVGKLILTALISYIATNADDLIILMNFFTEISIGNSKMKVRHVIIGQYLGFFILLLISLVGYLVSFVLPVEMLGFLGFLPIVIGMKNFIELFKKKHGTIDDILPIDPISTVQLEMIRYRKDNDEEITFQFQKQEEEQQQRKTTNSPSNKRRKSNLFKYLTQIFSISTLKVISITIANGGDNIAIYTPLFAQAFKWQIIVYIIIFLLMVCVWLVISYYFINYRPILNLAQKYARYIVPIIFIGIGIYIIWTSDCFPWLIRAIQTKDFKAG